MNLLCVSLCAAGETRTHTGIIPTSPSNWPGYHYSTAAYFLPGWLHRSDLSMNCCCSINIQKLCQTSKSLYKFFVRMAGFEPARQMRGFMRALRYQLRTHPDNAYLKRPVNFSFIFARSSSIS